MRHPSPTLVNSVALIVLAFLVANLAARVLQLELNFVILGDLPEVVPSADP